MELSLGVLGFDSKVDRKIKTAKLDTGLTVDQAAVPQNPWIPSSALEELSTFPDWTLTHGEPDPLLLKERQASNNGPTRWDAPQDTSSAGEAQRPGARGQTLFSLHEAASYPWLSDLPSLPAHEDPEPIYGTSLNFSGYGTTTPQEVALLSSLNAGRKTVELNKPIEREQPVGVVGGKNSCPECYRQFKTRPEVKKHILSTHRRPFVCNIQGCRRDKGFATKNDLERHKRSVHPEIPLERRYVCSLGMCGKEVPPKTFTRLDNFRRHLQRFHKREAGAQDILDESLYRTPKNVVEPTPLTSPTIPSPIQNAVNNLNKNSGLDPLQLVSNLQSPSGPRSRNVFSSVASGIKSLPLLSNKLGHGPVLSPPDRAAPEASQVNPDPSLQEWNPNAIFEQWNSSFGKPDNGFGEESTRHMYTEAPESKAPLPHFGLEDFTQAESTGTIAGDEKCLAAFLRDQQKQGVMITDEYIIRQVRLLSRKGNFDTASAMRILNSSGIQAFRDRHGLHSPESPPKVNIPTLWRDSWVAPSDPSIPPELSQGYDKTNTVEFLTRGAGNRLENWNFNAKQGNFIQLSPRAVPGANWGYEPESDPFATQFMLHQTLPALSHELYQGGAQLGPAVEVTDDPFTDSGYASVPYPEVPPKGKTRHDTKPADSPALDVAANDDSATEYSVATTVIPSLVRESILDVCKDIHARVGKELSEESWIAISGTIPGLIKAFAIMLGNNHNDFDQRVRHFVHRHHQEIFEQLKIMFQQVDDDAVEDHRPSSGAMSLLDKMSLWGRKAGQEPSKVEKTDLFQGIEEDEDEEDLVSANMPQYSKAILLSQAYDWLIANLLKQSTFHWDPSCPRIMIERFQEPILASLPKRKISRKGVVKDYQVAFWLPWHPIRSRIEDESARGKRSSIGSIITLTGSPSGQLQATTIKGYFEQTWVSSGTSVLDAIENEIGCRLQDICGDHSDQPSIKATIRDFALVLDVTGPAHFIAQCGEQLAWLGSALQPSLAHSYTACAAVLLAIPPSPMAYIALSMSSHFNVSQEEIQNFKTSPHIPNDQLVDQNWAITFECSEQLESSTTISPLQHFVPGLAVQGFPTLRRPDFCDGLEISGELVQRLLISASLDRGNGCIRIFASNCDFRLSRISGKALIWHSITSPGHVCSCKDHNILPQDFLDASLEHDLTNLWEYRHVFEFCCRSRDSERFHVADRPPPCKNGSHKDQPSMEEVGFSSPTYTSQVTSIDSDMLSISDESDEVCAKLRAPGDPHIQVLEVATLRLIEKFREARESGRINSFGNSTKSSTLAVTDNDGHSSGNGGLSGTQNGGSSSSLNLSSTPRDTQRSSRKRAREGDSDGDEGDGDGRRRRKRIAKPQETEHDSSSLACPFWKFDPVKHSQCFKRKLSKISYVKQHLQLKHAPEFYCDRCLDVFETSEVYEVHRRHASCKWDVSKALDGITYQQRGQLNKKSKSQLTDSERWFVIWDIIFPNQPRPPSAYTDLALSEEICHFREFSQSRGADIISDALQTSGFQPLPVDQRTLLSEAINRGLDRIYDEWLASRNPTVQLDADAASHLTSTSSVGDSGVAMGSHGTPSDTAPPLPFVGVTAETGSSRHEPINFEQDPNYGDTNLHRVLDTEMGTLDDYLNFESCSNLGLEDLVGFEGLKQFEVDESCG